MRIFYGVIGASCLFLLSNLISTSAYGACPPALVELSPLGEPPHSARVQPNPDASCPEIYRVSATLSQDGRYIHSRTFHASAIGDPPLVFPVRDNLEVPHVAGVYRIDWELEFSTGDTQSLRQPFLIPCPAPASVVPIWDDADSALRFDPVIVDVCEGYTDAELTLRDVSGDVVVDALSLQYPPDIDTVVFQLPRLEGERRYVGDLRLTNRSQVEMLVPVEVLTGCGPIVPEAMILDGRLLGSISASECQYPVLLEMQVVHSSGEVFQQFESVLEQPSFELPIPDFGRWPAGDFEVRALFHGAVSRARRDFPISVACTDPSVADIAVVPGENANLANLEFALVERAECQGDVRIRAQVRRADRTVVFNRSMDMPAATSERRFSWSFPAVPGATYAVSIEVEYGVGYGEQIDASRRSVLECASPEILDLGYADASGGALGALLSIAQCNAPAVAKLLVRSPEGRIVVESDPRILHRQGESHAVIDTTSISHLGDSTYSVELTVVDSSGNTATRTVQLEHVVSPPEVSFAYRGSPVSGGDFPTISSLEDLELVFTGSTPPLSAFSPVRGQLERAGSRHSAAFSQVDGEMTPQMWFGGYFEHPSDGVEREPVGVLVRNASGEYWVAPVVRTFVPSTELDLRDYHPSMTRVGFHAVARVDTLHAGSYAVSGVVVDHRGRQVLIPGSAAFRVTAAATRQHESVLRQGVSEIPVGVSWGQDNLARLERVASVPDGDYALSVVSRDMFGTPSEITTLSFRLDQDKARARLDWPAIASYERQVQHRFHRPEVESPGPLRVLPRRVTGVGEIRINGQRVTDQSVELLLTPDVSGRFTMSIELSDSDVDASFVIHPDDTTARPLELAVRTYMPQFIVQRLTSEDSHVLSIRTERQPCRHVIFDDLSGVSLRPEEVLCAVRLNVPDTSVSSVSSDRTEVRLPLDSSPSWMYEEGFVRVVSGEPVFHQLREVPIDDLRAFSSTPQVEFVSLPRWRNRASSDTYLTSPGRTLAGHVLIAAGLEAPLVFINDEPVEFSTTPSGDVRVPVFTQIDELGGADVLRIRAYYPSAPALETSAEYRFFSVPEEPSLRATGGQFVYPEPVSLSLTLATVSTAYSPEHHGHFEISDLRLIRRDVPDSSPVSVAPPAIADDGSMSFNFPSIAPGRYRVLATLVNVDPRFAAIFAPLSAEAEFEVLDGSPIPAELFSFLEADKAPFFGQVAIELPSPHRRRDISRVSWEISTDGQSFEPHYCCGSAVDFGLTEPGVRYFRAELKNRHSGVISYTPPLQLRSFLGGELRVLGPRHTFRGFPARYEVEGLPPGQTVLWRVLTPNATVPQEFRGPTLQINPEETGVYYIEVVADTGTTSPDDPSAFRTYFTLSSSWPRLPPPVISGPSEVEFGRVTTYTVIQPEIFPRNGNADIVRVGEWELPDGTRVPGEDWLEFTLRDLPEGQDAVTLVYRTWIEGDRTTLTTSSHVIRPVRYQWPDWELIARTASLQPPAIVRLSVAPPHWEQWMGLGGYSVQTHWELPPHIRVVHRTPTSAIVFARDDRPFSVVARITDRRGNVTELRKDDVRPAHRVPFDVTLRAVPERSLITAPINVSAHVDPIVVPQGRSVNRVVFYLDGRYVGVTDGAPLDIRLTTPGAHEIRAIASVDGEFSTSAAITVDVGHNIRATCTIAPVGDFRLNGLARAECHDPDGHIVEYRWYADGQLLSDSGARVTLSRSQLHSVSEVSLIAVDNGGLETTARYVVPPRGISP